MRIEGRLGLLALCLATAHCAGGSSVEPGPTGGSGTGGGASGGAKTSSGGPGSSGAYPTSSSGSSGDQPTSSGASSGDPGSSSGSSGSPASSGSTSGSSSGPTPGDDAAPSSSGGQGSNCFPAMSGDFTADGPLTATSGDVTSVSCTITRPTVLGSNGCLNPVIVWGNGTFNTPTNYTALFNHFATHGFIVAAADTSNSGSGKEMLACLQYMIDQNTASGSPYQGHIDTAHIASSGYSQGGAGCLEAGIDPRFAVTAPVSPYIVIALGGYDTTSVMKQVHPMFMISGDADTVATPSTNQQPIFDMAPVPIVWGTHAGSTHFEVLNNGGAYAGPLTAWFRYKLMGDDSAGNWFKKTPCTLCSTTGWTVQHNSMWTD